MEGALRLIEHAAHRGLYDRRSEPFAELLDLLSCKYCTGYLRPQVESHEIRNPRLAQIQRFQIFPELTGFDEFERGKYDQGVRALGLQTCMTLGMLDGDQARRLADAGLDYYNHNIDTSPEYYGDVITTRAFQDRLETLAHVREARIAVCCGGILGMGESRADRVNFIHALATLPRHPESVPVNALVPVRGTKLGDRLADDPGARIDDIEFVRTVAVARLTMPRSMVRLSAGRESMSDAVQALCFLAGANSIFAGDKLLTTPNSGASADATLFAKLGARMMTADGEPARLADEGALGCA